MIRGAQFSATVDRNHKNVHIMQRARSHKLPVDDNRTQHAEQL